MTTWQDLDDDERTALKRLNRGPYPALPEAVGNRLIALGLASPALGRDRHQPGWSGTRHRHFTRRQNMIAKKWEPVRQPCRITLNRGKLDFLNRITNYQYMRTAADIRGLLPFRICPIAGS